MIFVEQLAPCSCSNAPFESNSTGPSYCTFDWQRIIGFLFISNASFMPNCEPNMKEKKVYALFFLLDILLFLEETIFWLNCWNDWNFLLHDCSLGERLKTSPCTQCMCSVQSHFFCSCLFFGGVLGVVWTFDNYVYRFSNKLEYKEKQMIWPSFPGLVLACEELWGITQMEVLNPRRISQNSFNFVIVSSWS